MVQIEMGRITKNLEIEGSKGSKIVEVLFDSGAEDSFIRRDLAQDICDIIVPRRPAEFTLGDGETEIKPTGLCTLTAEIEECGLGWTAWVADRLSRQVIIGADVLQKYNLKLDFEHHKVDASQCRRKFELI